MRKPTPPRLFQKSAPTVALDQGKPVPEFDWSVLDARIVEAGFPAASKRPEGSFSTMQFGQKEGLSRSGAVGRLRVLEQAGIVECLGRLYISGGKGPATYFWRVKGRAK